MIKLRLIKFCRSNSSKLASGGAATTGSGAAPAAGSTNKAGEIKWELRPGGMLVQKRECADNAAEDIITLRVSTVSKCHHISIPPTSTFGELKMLMSLMIGLEPKEQRVLYKGKEREDYECLHMVGVSNNDKLLLLQDPAINDRKLHRPATTPADQVVGASYRTITV